MKDRHGPLLKPKGQRRNAKGQVEGGAPGRPPGIEETKPRETAARKAMIADALRELLATGHGMEIAKNMIALAESQDGQAVSAATFVRDTTEGKPPTRVQIEELQPIIVEVPAGGELPEESHA
jgi:hypothetical protein